MLSQIHKHVTAPLAAAAVRVDETASEYSHIYRWFSYHAFSPDTFYGPLYEHRITPVRLERFFVEDGARLGRWDMDTLRSPDTRRRNFARISRIEFDEFVPFAELACESRWIDGRRLYELTRYRIALLGDRDYQQTKDYLRRAALQLHPDKTRDLVGWDIPGRAQWDSFWGLPYDAEPALTGAKLLYAAHQQFSALLGIDHYRQRLWSRRARLGKHITPMQAVIEITTATILAAAVQVLRKQSLLPVYGASAAAYALVAFLHLRRCRQKRRDAEFRARRTRTSDALVLYQPILQHGRRK